MTTKQTLADLGFDVSEIVGPHADKFGAAMGALFDIAHAVEHYGREYVPGAWAFRDSLICDGLTKHPSGENDSARFVAARIARSSDCERAAIHAGNVLDRYIGILDRAGLGY